MITFSEIAIRYLNERGYEAYECESEEEARKRASELIVNKKWPCYFFKSDTTGEKDFEEFFTDNENLNMDLYKAIGVISNQPHFDDKKLNEFANGIHELRKKALGVKMRLLIYSLQFCEFTHKETGKYLDQRM